MGLVVTLSMSAAACGKEEETAEVSKVAVEVQTPESGELSVETAYIGSITPQEQVYVIPKASGTVTAVNFAVGDTVQEGDVLFKIDDEAAKLQMASANAAYTAAQAGVTAQSDGARDLQNYQTEEQIRQLKETLYDTDDTISDMEDNLGDVRDALKNLNSALSQANAGLETANKTYYDKQNELNPQIEAVQKEIEESEASEDVTDATEKLESLKAELAGYQKGVSDAQTAVDNLKTQISSLEATKTQLKTGIDTAEDGMDTIRDNLNMAEQAYAITQNEIYPQSDAASAASLSQAAVGIDSAQMQLDFCTVKAPISGVVEAVNVEKNGMAAAGSYAFIISNKESMTVTFNVAEKAKNTLAIGDPITVEHNGATYNGNITEIGTMAGLQTKLFQVKASVTGASDSLPNGVSVKVYATTQKQQSDLIIPYDSVYFSAGNAYVYCVEDGKAVKTAVTVGLMNDTEVVIVEGLTEESQIIANWSSKLRNGAEVEILSVNGEEAATEEAAAEETPAADAKTAEEAE